MDPKIWGANMWYILHIITFTYPSQPTEHDKSAYHDFFHNLKHVIPCDECKKHYTKYISQYPITPHLDRKADVIKWLIQIHNFVNISLNKPIYEPAEVLKLYANLKPTSPFVNLDEKIVIGKKKNDVNTTLLYGLLIICVFCIIITKYLYKKNYYYY